TLDKFPNVRYKVTLQRRVKQVIEIVFDDWNITIIHYKVGIRGGPHEARLCNGVILYFFRYLRASIRIDVMNGNVRLPYDYEECLIGLFVGFRYVCDVKFHRIAVTPCAEDSSPADVAQLKVGLVDIAFPGATVQGRRAGKHLLVGLIEVCIYQPVLRRPVQKIL